MHRRQILALGGAILALVVVPSGALAAKVTVRVEGKTHTLLLATKAQTHAGSITKGGAPAGACSASGAAGALDVATHHSWAGKFYTSFNDYLINAILGETQTTKSYYWGFWIDNKFSSTGVCKTPLKPGDQLLFAVDSVAHHEHPLGLIAPAHARRNHAFSVKVVWYSDAGVSKPLAGAHVNGGVTNSQGIIHILPTKAGTLVLSATDKAYIRDEVRVHVSS